VHACGQAEPAVSGRAGEALGWMSSGRAQVSRTADLLTIKATPVP
jgi:hypothetical protein